MELREFVVAEIARQRDRKIEIGDAFATAEQFVDRHPEVQLVVRGAYVSRGIRALLVIDDRVLRAETLLLALHLHCEIGGKALRHGAEVERLVRIEALEPTGHGVVERPDGAEPRDAGAREAQLCVAAVHRIRRVPVFQREDHHAQLLPVSAGAQRLHRRRHHAVNVVLHGIDFDECREAAEFHALTVGGHGRRCERVIEKTAVGTAGVDGARARDVEIAEAGIAAIDARERLEELDA